MNESKLEQMINDNKGLVFYTLNKFNKEQAFDEDYHQIALIGLWKACEGFDENKNIKFSTYAVNVIRNEIADALRKERANKRLDYSKVISLNETYGDENSLTLIDNIEDKNDLINIKDYQLYIEQLKGREKTIVEMKSNESTFKEIADEVGLSTQRVEQLWKKYKRKLVKECL